MSLVKKISKIIIIGGILLVIFAIYINSVIQQEQKENPANTFIGSDFSVSNNPPVTTKALAPSPTPTVKPLAKNAFRYVLNNGKSEASFDVQVAKNQTVFSVLEDLSKEQKFEIKSKMYSVGILIQSIDGYAGGDEGKYWQYYINGSLGQVAADKHTLKAGDMLEWKFEKVPEY